MLRALVRRWERNFLLLELILAAVLVAGLALWAHHYGGSVWLTTLVQPARGATYSALAAIFGSLLGFVIAAAAIVLGHVDSPRLKIVRDSGQLNTLWRVFASAMRALAFATVVAVVGLLLDSGRQPMFAMIYAMVFAALLATFRVARSIWALENVVRLSSGAGATKS